MSKSKRVLAWFLVLALVFGMLFGFGGAILLVRYPTHNCCGQRCFYCEVMNVIDAFLHQGGALLAIGTIGVVLAVVVFCRVGVVRCPRLVSRTPITLKTKLLN